MSDYGENRKTINRGISGKRIKKIVMRREGIRGVDRKWESMGMWSGESGDREKIERDIALRICRDNEEKEEDEKKR